MKIRLHWKEGLIFEEGKTIGYFVKNTFAVCDYQLYEKQLIFRNSGYRKGIFSILDEKTNIIGMIYTSKLVKSTKIIMADIEYELKLTSFFRRKWTLYANNNQLIEFHKGFFQNGKLKSIFKDEHLIMACLFVLNSK